MVSPLPLLEELWAEWSRCERLDRSSDDHPLAFVHGKRCECLQVSLNLNEVYGHLALLLVPIYCHTKRWY